MISIRQIIAAWNRFFYEPISPLDIAAYRILFGILLLVNELLILPDFTLWYGEGGSLSRIVARDLPGGAGMNLLSALPAGDASAWAFFALMLLAIVTLTLGLFTRTSAAVVFVCLVSFNHRNVLPLNGGDTFFRIATFFLIFSHAGDCLSLDRSLRRSRGPIKPAAPWAQRMIQIQLSLVYITTFLWKVRGSMWLDGTAIYYTSRLQDFWRFPVPYLFEHMWTIKLWTWGTLVVEFALGFLIWIREFRYPVLLAGILLHLGIDYSINIPLFAPIMITAYITFVEPAHIGRFLAFCKTYFGPSKNGSAPIARPAKAN